MLKMGSEPRQFGSRVYTLMHYQESESVYLLMFYYIVKCKKQGEEWAIAFVYSYKRERYVFACIYIKYFLEI